MSETPIPCPQCGGLAKLRDSLLVGKPDHTLSCIHCDLNVYGDNAIQTWLMRGEQQSAVMTPHKVEVFR